MSTTHNATYVAVATALEAGLPLTDRPTTWSAIDAICDAMRAAGRAELVHYAGACYRDDVAWQMCIAWQADRAADEATLKQRALLAAGWGLIPVEHIRATAARYSCEWVDYSGIHLRAVLGPVGALEDCCRWLAEQPRISGPNEPMSERILYRDGKRVSIIGELERAGYRPLYRLDFAGREVWCGF